MAPHRIHPLSKRIIDYCKRAKEHADAEDDLPESTSLSFPPASTADLNAAEQSIGTPIPILLRTLLSEVGNGGFGPGGGLFGVPSSSGCGNDMVKALAEWRERNPPEGLVPLCHWGCAHYSAIYVPDGRIIRCYDLAFDELFFEDESLESWLDAWMSGEDLFESRAFGDPITPFP